MNVGFVSLGCSKNLVDTEMTIGMFRKNNFKIVSNPEDADIIVVNTCGFIESAKDLKLFILCITKQHSTVLYLSGVHPDLATQICRRRPRESEMRKGKWV